MSDRLLELIGNVVADINERRDEKIPTDDLLHVSLYGDSGVFDSMHLVNFLTLVEEAIEDEYDVEISLTSEKAVSRRISPFSGVGRLIEFIEEEMALAGAETGHGSAA
ncbi:hypothetical protein ACIG54_25320 [Streptomyces achromogenes]|uniref:hypothetical protein n=1 Tax=Streptomyces achromogenes TaxID=67255 RepID=UPI0004C7696E|nr:hypothetical protein [Streptomyces achromogenes]MCZ0205472.1 hypothetical protein [Streptomyces sp. UMAF16]